MEERLIWHSLTDEEKDIRLKSQMAFEQEMLDYGREKYWREYDRSPDEGIPEQELIDTSVKELQDLYQEWIDKVCRSARCPNWIHPLIELGSKKMADVTLRAIVRNWFSSAYWGYNWQSNQIVPPLAQSVASQISQDALDIINFQRAKDNNREEWLKQSKFVKNWTTKRCKAFALKLEENTKLSVKHKHDFGHHMLRIAAESNVIKLVTHRIKQKNYYRNLLSVEFHPSVLKELHNRHEFLQNSSLIYRPMISKPVPHKQDCSGGYITSSLRKPVVQRYKSNFFSDEPISQRFSEPSQIVLDGLNTMMDTEWCVNEKVYDVMKDLFENNTGLANLPYYSFEEFMYNEPYPKDGTKEEQAIWCQRKEEAWGKWYKQEQSRGRMLVRLQLAKDLIKCGWFYHVYTCDFRGRAYTVCELLSPQSSDTDRGLIKLKNAVKLTERGRYWQKINLANLFDQDKVSFDDRIKWVDDNWDMIQRISEDPYSNKEWIDSSPKKNKSFQRLAAIYDITRTDGYSDVPVNIDGKCNGNQHWSAIMGDESIAKLTGVLPSETPQDLYQHVADNTTDYLVKFKETNPWYDKFLSYWENKIKRAVTKRPTMCEPYGITFYGIQKYLKEEGHLDWVDRDKKGGAIVELARAIKSSLDLSLGEPNKGKQYLKTILEEANKANVHATWVTPSGFKVVHYYNKQQKKRSLAALFNRKELIFYVRTRDVNPREALQAISPNFIHSLDAAHMFLTIAMISNLYGVIDLCMIHDSYGCHANDIDIMRDCLRQTFVDIHAENQLENFKNQLENQLGINLPSVPERGIIDISSVLSSEYFFA